ncbi:MAG: alpha/beta hydrolase [Thermoflexales bacterium]|nr:alpha/beta hydrolase [Thermoflexales bacterium]
MRNVRLYGESPYGVALVHGGPGAGGEMTPVARELAPNRGVLEALQTATSLEGQVEELKTVLEENAQLPVRLIGFSWGAWLSCLLAAGYPQLVSKLVLIGSGPFEQRYVSQLEETRLSRLNEPERAEFQSTVSRLNEPAEAERDALLARLGVLASKADAYDPLPHESERLPSHGDIFQGVWQAAAELRRSGQLLDIARRIRCPVVAIHGDYDPHPAAGVREPLSAALERFRFIMLERCGHTPWLERQARASFYAILERELAAY